MLYNTKFHCPSAAPVAVALALIENQPHAAPSAFWQ